MTTQTAIERDKSAFSNFSDAELIARKHAREPISSEHIAAVQLLHERQLAAHAELLAEIKRTHWSVTPGFWVGVVAMVAACIAAYGVLVPQPQAQSPSAATAPSIQIVPPAPVPASKSPQQFPSSTTSQSRKHKD